MTISAIVAMTPDRVIGANNKLLWHLPEDLKRFRKITESHAIVMGRKTYESIGKPLPNRTNIVLTRDSEYDLNISGLTSVTSVEDVVNAFKHHELFVIGGGEIYKAFMPFIETIYVTTVLASIYGDTYFPEIDPSEWKEDFDFLEVYDSDEKNPYRMLFRKYDKLF